MKTQNDSVRARRRIAPRPPGSLPPSTSDWGESERALPSSSQPTEDNWANEPGGFFACGDQNSLWALGARVVLVLLVFVASLSSQAAVREVGAIGLTVGDLDRALDFYTKVLPFEKVSESKSAPGAADELLGLSGTQLRSADLKLGDERITLTEHLTRKGQSIPQDSHSFDHWFQHIAIVVRDMDNAYERLRQLKVKHISTAPQTLPAWNKDAGGIKAFYFRDPEDHVLEIIWFPQGKGDPKWHPSSLRYGATRPDEGAPGSQSEPLFLGIDHTAMVVSDTDQSLAFYRDLLGMRVAGGAENYGVEQEHLNQVFGARLRITALRAERGPGIEFLEYITPPGGRPLPEDASANDLIFWHTRLVTYGLEDVAAELRKRQTKFVSTRVVALPGESSDSRRGVIVRDPDGHALQFIEPGNSQGNEALTSRAKAE